MEVYLDNSATTMVTEGVRDKMIKVLEEDFGNPSSMHMLGVRAENYIKDGAKEFAHILKVDPKEIVFTSGGTESNNLAIIGSVMANKRRGNHIITSKIEHPSVHEPFAYLEDNGFDVSYVSVDGKGKIVKEELYGMVREDTLLVSIMYVNNEIGAVQDIEEIIQELKKIKNDLIIHVDGVQAFGKYRIYPKRLGIDLLSISGHKIHGPKGTGVLYVNSKTRINPIVFGGGHQRGLRSGTENVPGIAGIGQAAVELYTDFDEKMDRMYQLKQHFIKEISKLEGVSFNGLTIKNDHNGEVFDMEVIKETAPHIISVSFEGVRSEVLLHALEDRGIYVSAGSACSSHSPKPSTTLAAIRLPKELMESTLRFSISDSTTREEIDYTINVINELLPMLRRYKRK
ncbi:MAG TPA: cysteine desulfurase [Clostridiales bacterium]|nr:cysteine desulfurase [Clostridiales bacterium]